MKLAKPSRRRAVALILALAFIVLIAASIVGFFVTATSARRESAGYESGIAAKQLADMVTNIVMGQIADATRSWEIPPASPAVKGGGARLTYSTQPGLIRTYTETGTRGRIFKLYSSDTMVTNAGKLWSVGAELNNEVAPNWPAQPAHFTDLNQPVLIEDVGGLIMPAGATRKFSAAYPIVNPLAMLPVAGASAGVEGFDLRGVPGFKGGSGQPTLNASDDPTAPAAAGQTSNAAPMPVRWIYVLQDGTLTTPGSSSVNTLTADWSALPAGSPLRPSATNPIVGRIAFWTDDETCKLNVNTSGEPTPWDTPRAVTIQDLKYGQFQPAQQEYQRFPGHPFTTALSPVLFPGVKLTSPQKEDIYKIIPRLGTGGTLAATRAIPATATATGATRITLDADRLYANVDEFLFAPPASGAAVRPENPAAANSTLPKFKDQLKRSRFFLTANSRAPEVTLFGTPRISLWPVSTSAALRTTFDTLAAFCTSVGPGAPATPMPFYFQRLDSTSPKTDYDNIARNRELYQYLQALTAKPVPGYGGNFKQKWGDDRDQVLTEIFDYIRCVNLRDPVLVAQGKTRYADNGQVAPIQIGSTQGFGRYHTISQFGFHFICAQDGADGASDANNPKLPDGERSIEAAFLFSPFSPSLGFYKIAEDLEYDVTFQKPFTIDSQDLQMKSGNAKLNNGIGSGWHNNGREHGGPGGLRGPVQAFGGGGYVFISKAKTRVKLKKGADTMSFSGGTIQVKLKIKGNLIQTFNLDFPGGTFPAPKLVRTGTDAYQPGGNATTSDFWWTFAKRYSRAGETPHAPGPEYSDPTRRWSNSNGPPGFKVGGLFRAEDVVRSIVPDHGDLRFIAAKSQINSSEFVKVRTAEWDSNFRFLHVFVSPAGSHFLYGFANEPGPSPSTNSGDIPSANSTDQLVPDSRISYHYSKFPEIRPGAGLKYNRWGDFDNGMANWADGAYINKPDEGNQASTSSPYTYFAWNFTAANDSFFSPSRLVPSAGMLGSLPTGIKRHTTGNPHAWETLLFRPEVRKYQGQQHPGLSTPKDHLIMDLFWMPVGEPYPISEPFSTAGKVNLNYEIAPFSYIRRTTALRGAMKAEEPLVLINSGAKIYKLWDHDTNDYPKGLPNAATNDNTDSKVHTDWDKAYNGKAPFDKFRRAIDVEKTLAQADTRFANGEAFRSATEICELHLVRDGEKLSDYQNGTIYNGALPTGDNTRERPYANLYAKLTTKSNTFNVHLRVQILRKRSGGTVNHAVWNEGIDSVIAEHRGSVLIERYVDASDPSLPDFATKTDATLDNYARFRIVSTNKFAP